MQNLAFLNSVPILAPLDPMERQILASAVESVKFAPGEEVFREGQEGDVFYMIKEGEATVTQLSKEDATPLIVNQLFSSDFFGEKALFDNAPRNATVTAKPDKGCTCLCLSRDKFVQILGPLQDLSRGRAEPPIGLKPPSRRPEGEEEDLLEASFSNETAEEKFEANSAFEDF